MDTDLQERLNKLRIDEVDNSFFRAVLARGGFELVKQIDEGVSPDRLRLYAGTTNFTRAIYCPTCVLEGLIYIPKCVIAADKRVKEAPPKNPETEGDSLLIELFGPVPNREQGRIRFFSSDDRNEIYCPADNRDLLDKIWRTPSDTLLERIGQDASTRQEIRTYSLLLLEGVKSNPRRSVHAFDLAVAYEIEMKSLQNV